MGAYSLALNWLARRELSRAQLRARLARRHFPSDEIDAALERLTTGRMLDDRRVALAAARREGAIRGRGRRRVLQRVQQLGVAATLAEAAVDEVFRDLDEGALLDSALQRKLKGMDPRALDARAIARIVRSLTAQGFDAGAVFARLRARSGGFVPDAE